MIKIPKRSEISDARSILANAFCDLIVEKCGNDLDKSLQYVLSNDCIKMFENTIRNFYELVSVGYEIPLFVYAEKIDLGKDGYGHTEEEHLANLEICRKACFDFYIKKD